MSPNGPWCYGPHPDMSHAARLARYSEVSSSLALLSDRTLGRLVDDGVTTGWVLAGASASVVLFAEYIPQVLRVWLDGQS
ncbi:MAG: hypothetical protein ACRDOA_13555 [Streptosporangiaceae bacterium]